MEVIASKFPLFASVEALITDVQGVTSSELSLRQLTALIEEEFGLEKQHMERGQDPPINCKNEIRNVTKGKPFPWCLFATKLVIGVTFILLLLLLAVILDPERIDDAVSKFPLFVYLKGAPTTSPEHSLSGVSWYFCILQLLRWSSTHLSIESRYPITDYDSEGCLIDNPLYRMEQLECSACRKITGFTYELGGSFDRPVVVKNLDIDFNLGRFQQLLQKNEIMMNRHTMSVSTNCSYVRTVEDLKSNRVLELLEQDNEAHIVGTSVSYMSSHILRKDFPRPQDYVYNAAQTFTSSLYIDGKNSSSFPLQRSVKESMFMYIQCSGSRRLVFTPPSHCLSRCYSFSRVMKEGDLVFFSSLYTVHSEPTKDKSFSYVDNFEWIAG